jgi:polar amino acid transport system substrate-binding protein
MRFPECIGWRGRLLILVVGLLTLIAVVVMLIRGSQGDHSLDRVQAAGVLRIGLDASFPPFEALDETGAVTGVDVELAHLIAARLGVRAEFANIGFDGLYDALQAGRVDAVISGLPYDERRTRDVIYSQPYFNAGQVLVVPAVDAAAWDVDADLPASLTGRRVAVEWGSLGDMYARQWQATVPGLHVEPYTSAAEALQALVDDLVDAAIADAVSVRQFMRDHPGTLEGVRAMTDEPYVIATSRKAGQLARAIDAVLSELLQSGAVDELLDR